MFLFHSFTWSWPVYPGALAKETVCLGLFFPPLYIFVFFVMDRMLIDLQAFYLVPLVPIFVFVPVPYCLDDCSFVIQSEVKKVDSSSSLLRLLRLLGVLCVSIQLVKLFGEPLILSLFYYLMHFMAYSRPSVYENYDRKEGWMDRWKKKKRKERKRKGTGEKRILLYLLIFTSR